MRHGAMPFDSPRLGNYRGGCLDVLPRYSPAFEKGPERLRPGFRVVTAGARLQLIGELDIAADPVLRASVAEVDSDIELDCSGLTFIDCSGLQLLQELRHACDAEGVRLTLIDPARCLTRLLDLVGLDGFFDVLDASKS